MRISIGALALAACGSVPAQNSADYPRKPVRVVISLAPGSAVDQLTRIFTQRLGETTGQQFVVEARPGAAGMVGAQYVAKAPPDGYTLLVTTNAPLTTHFAMYQKMEYSWEDFEPIMVVAQAPVVLMVYPKLGLTSVPELVALSERTQVGLTLATAGNGSIGQFLMSELQTKLGAVFIHVPY